MRLIAALSSASRIRGDLQRRQGAAGQSLTSPSRVAYYKQPYLFPGVAMLLVSRLASALVLLLGIHAAAAQQARPPAANAGAKPGEMQMSVITLTVLIKDAVIALHHANMTGNYSVLRDMGTPVFRENFDQTALAAAFANLRARRIDLSPAYFLSPNLSKKPELSKDNELMLAGFFPTQPLQIQFDLRFMQLDGRWRLAGIGVDAVPASGPQAAAAAPAPAQQPAPGQDAKKPAGKPKS
jgi:hypothetical protein